MSQSLGDRRTVARCASGCPRQLKAKNYRSSQMKQLSNWKTESNPPRAIMFSLLFPSCCFTNHIFHPGACWCRVADCRAYHSTSWLLQPGPGSRAGGSLTTIPAHRLQNHQSRCCGFKEILPHLKWLQSTFYSQTPARIFLERKTMKLL
jgi:hypothetical protein